MFMVCSWQGCPWKLGKWWTWVPCKYVRRELLHFGQGFVGEPKVSFPGPVPALKSTAVAWHSHPTWNSWISQVNWPSTWHFFLQVSKKFSLQWLWFSFVYHFLVTEGLLQQQSVHSEIWLQFQQFPCDSFQHDMHQLDLKRMDPFLTNCNFNEQ